MVFVRALVAIVAVVPLAPSLVQGAAPLAYSIAHPGASACAPEHTLATRLPVSPRTFQPGIAEASRH